MRKLLYILAMLAAVTCSLFPAFADDDGVRKTSKEEWEAAFLFQFLKYVAWPDPVTLSKTHTATICIIGGDPFGPILDAYKARASSPQLAVNLKREATAADIPTCNILFINGGDDAAEPVLQQVGTLPILTVSEVSGFADKGGIIEIAAVHKDIGLFSKDKITLRINLRTAERQSLHIDPQLLDLPIVEVIK